MGEHSSTNACILYGLVSQPIDDETLYEGQVFTTKDEIVKTSP